MKNTRTPRQAFKDAQESGAIGAWLEGKEIQYATTEQPGIWHNFAADFPNWSLPNLLWRPKPLTFPDPPEGEKWQNPDNLTPDQLGEEYRLLLESEIINRYYEAFIHTWNDGMWDTYYWKGSSLQSTYRVPASTPFHWDKPKLIRVPLGPEDVPPGSVLRKLHSPAAVWVAPAAVLTTSILHAANFSGDIEEISWENLKNHWQILRPGRDPATGWEPCWKEVEQKGK